MRSLRLKILATAAALVVLSQAGTVVTVLVTASRDVSGRAGQTLAAGARVFQQTEQARSTHLTTTVSVLAADYAFKQAVASRDTDTIASALFNHARRGGAEMAFLLDNDGQVVATSRDLPEIDITQAALIAQGASNGMARSIAFMRQQSFEMITVPVRAPLPIGWVSMGFTLDDDYMNQIQALTRLDASLVSERDGETVVIASSLERPIRDALPEVMGLVGHDDRATVQLSGSDYQLQTLPFLPDSADLKVVLTRSMTDAMAPYLLLRNAAILLGALPLLLALAGAILLSRTLTRPVQQLAEAARRMRIGDYSQNVSVPAGDELGELAAAFNAMQADIARREERITHQARFDSLTDLPNRDYALEQMETAIGRASGEHKPLAVMALDLNGYHEIAASLGHDIADSYARQAAALLRMQIEQGFTLARLESDKFIVVMPGLDAARAADIAERLLGHLEPGVGLPDLTVSVRPVIGIAVFPDHGDTGEQLLLRATVAQNDCNADSPIGLYHGGDENRRLRRLAILGDLRGAIRHEELKLFYQPKISLADGRVCGAEALVRWDHPGMGRLSPVEFIPIAEQSGNITLLTRWALTAAARECRFWLEEGLDIPVSVNLSASDLLDRDLPWFVTEVLRNHDLPPRLLIAEITEEGLVRDFANATLVLQRLRDLGIKISIDDFGTGYSSLAQIRNLPVDELKIDKSFIQQLPGNRADAAITSAAIDLAHNLGLEFVAEGVETQSALDWLREQGCERIQGFYISQPLPADEFIVWVRGYSGHADWQQPARRTG